MFKLIHYDIANSDLKVKVPSVKGKEVHAGLVINDNKAQSLTLNKLYEYNDVKGLKLDIRIDGVDENGYGVAFDKYTIYSSDMAPKYLREDKIPNTDDIIVIDQYKNVIPLSAVLKALEY